MPVNVVLSAQVQIFRETEAQAAVGTVVDVCPWCTGDRVKDIVAVFSDTESIQAGTNFAEIRVARGRKQSRTVHGV